MKTHGFLIKFGRARAYQGAYTASARRARLRAARPLPLTSPPLGRQREDARLGLGGRLRPGHRLRLRPCAPPTPARAHLVPPGLGLGLVR